MNLSPDVVVVGAGIVGAACGAELKRRGYRVLIVDQFEPGIGETGSALGVAGLDDQYGADFDLQQLGLALWHEWIEREPLKIAVNCAGSLWVAENPADWMLLQHKAETLRDRRVACEVIPGLLLNKVEPALSKQLSGGIFLPDDIVIRPSAVLHSLLASIPDRSFGPESKAIVLGNGFVQLAGGRRIDCGAVVNAAGAGSANLTPGLSLIEERSAAFVVVSETQFRRMVRCNGFNIRPRQDGFVCSMTGDDRDRFHALIGRLVPSMKGQAAPTPRWIVASSSPDGVPIVGPSPSQVGVWLACGLGSRGMTTVWGAARIVADQLEGYVPPIEDSSYRPQRFVHLRAARG